MNNDGPSMTPHGEDRKAKEGEEVLCDAWDDEIRKLVAISAEQREVGIFGGLFYPTLELV